MEELDTFGVLGTVGFFVFAEANGDAVEEVTDLDGGSVVFLGFFVAG